MRILYHHRTLADGAEGIHIAAMVDAFRSLGHDVSVRGLAAPRGQLYRPGLVHMVRLALPDPVLELAAASLNVAELIEARRAIRDYEPDLVYKRHARYDIATLMAARRAGVPTVLEVNSLFSQGQYEAFEPVKLRRLATWFEKRALESATVVAAVSTPLARQIRSLAPREVHVLPNGTDSNQFDPRLADPAGVRQRHGLTDRLIIGWAGILREWHGLELLLEALAAVPQAHLMLVGDGPSRPAIERRAAALGLGDRVIITGRVEHAEVRNYISAFDVAVVADERTGVASPMKLVEYMALARAVVAPRLENIRDLIEDGTDGLLFTPGDAAELGAVLRKAIADPALRLRLGRCARAKVENERNWRAIARQVLTLVSASTQG